LTPVAGIINIDQPSRTKLVGYPGRMMLRDIKRRTLIRKYWPERFRYQTLRKNMIFPDSFKVTMNFLKLKSIDYLFFYDRIIVEKKNFQRLQMKLNHGGDGIDVH
jgi:hypothetical protein